MKFFFFLNFQPYSKGPNTSLEGVLGWFWGLKPILRRYLDLRATKIRSLEGKFIKVAIAIRLWVKTQGILV